MLFCPGLSLRQVISSPLQPKQLLPCVWSTAAIITVFVNIRTELMVQEYVFSPLDSGKVYKYIYLQNGNVLASEANYSVTKLEI